MAEKVEKVGRVDVPVKKGVDANEKKRQASEEVESKKPPVVHPLVIHRNRFSFPAIRQGIAAHDLLCLLEQRQTASSEATEDLLKHLFLPNNALFKEVCLVKDAFEKRYKANFSLAVVGALFNAGDERERAILSLILCAVDKETFVNEYLVKALEQDGSSEKKNDDYSFCIKLLNSQRDSRLWRLLGKVDFERISIPINFADSLSRLNRHKIILDSLVSRFSAVSGEKFSTELEGDIEEREKNLRKVTIRFIQNVEKAEKTEKAENVKKTEKTIPAWAAIHLQKLYGIYADRDSLLTIGRLLALSKDQKQIEFLKQIIFEESEKDWRSGNRRFYAMSSLFNALGEGVIGILEDFISSGQNLFLVNYATYNLLRLNEKGRSALLKVIQEKIDGNTPCFALGSFVVLLKLDKPCLDLLKSVFCLRFQEPGNFIQAFKNLKDFEFPLVTEENGSTLFNYEKEDGKKPVSLVLVILERLKLKQLVQWASNKDESCNGTRLVTNARDFLNYAASVHPGKVAGSIAAEKDNDTICLLKKLADIP